MSYSLEVCYEIWSDKEGHHTEVGPDRDSGNLIEIRGYPNDSREPYARLTFSPEEAKLVREALDKMLGCM